MRRYSQLPFSASLYFTKAEPGQGYRPRSRQAVRTHDVTEFARLLEKRIAMHTRYERTGTRVLEPIRASELTTGNRKRSLQMRGFP